MKHILIEARSLSGAGGGVQTYTRELVENISKQTSTHTYTVLYGNRGEAQAFPGVQSEVIPLQNEALLPLWLHVQVPRLLRRLKPDLVHFTKADVPARKRFPTIVTLHDVIPLLLPHTQSLLRRFYWPAALHRAAAQSDHILTISQASKQGIIEHLGVDSRKITVIPLGINHGHFKPIPAENIQPVLRAHAISGPYILFVGTRDIRKNIGALLNAFARIQHDVPHTLIIVGRPGDRRDEAEALISRLGLSSRARILGQVAHQDVPALYSGADLFVWPSVYEGWGFPPLEAMACGTAVITSDGGALPEAVGDAGIIVPFSEKDILSRLQDADFVERLSQEMRRILTDDAARAALVAAGLKRVQQFPWKTLAEKTLAVYDQVAVP